MYNACVDKEKDIDREVLVGYRVNYGYTSPDIDSRVIYGDKEIRTKM